MIRKKTGLKEVTILVLASAALVSVACGDDDDGDGPGTSGSAGTSTAGTKSTGGSAGTGTGGTSTAGTSSGGGGSGGTAGSAVGGDTTGGVPTDGGMGGVGGEPVVGGAAGAAGEDAGGAGGEGGAPVVVFDTLKNPSFEVWNADKTIVAEWTNVTTPAGASYCEWSTDTNKEGSYRLAHWTDVGAYTARTEQVVSPIANGKYTFSIWVNRDVLANTNESYIYAKGFDAEDAEADVQADTDPGIATGYVEVKIENIEVTSGAITVGVFTDAKSDAWLNFDLASLTLIPE